MSNVNACTLFEGHYHYGLGALINSLHSCGFAGVLWVGYRGELPDWIEQLSVADENNIYLVAKNFRIFFIKLETQTHFTLYKPDFMLLLIEKYCPTAEFMFYFDPDIIIKVKWNYFLNWAKHGIALSEDVNSPLSITSPLRCDWRIYFFNRGIELICKDDIYVNGGFIGVASEYFEFLEKWKTIQDMIKPDLPSMSQIGLIDRSHLFNKLDQDALNIAKDLTGFPVAVANKDSMDFSPGGSVMSHAIGRPKPWEKNFLGHLFVTGNRPTITDKLFFKHVRHPVEIYRNRRFKLAIKYLNIKAASIFSRLIGN